MTKDAILSRRGKHMRRAHDVSRASKGSMAAHLRSVGRDVAFIAMGTEFRYARLGVLKWTWQVDEESGWVALVIVQ